MLADFTLPLEGECLKSSSYCEKEEFGDNPAPSDLRKQNSYILRAGIWDTWSVYVSEILQNGACPSDRSVRPRPSRREENRLNGLRIALPDLASSAPAR